MGLDVSTLELIGDPANSMSTAPGNSAVVVWRLAVDHDAALVCRKRPSGYLGDANFLDPIMRPCDERS